ncbi:MAG TPA: hypothetical protein VFK05_24265 [Polyangiaceae bacterium]|nr:hypothetical protein [Polyangiaceae bacterium]
MMRVASCVSTVWVLAMVLGCSGGQTGDLSGENDKKGRSTGNTGCEDQLSEVELDDASALGFDARGVLAFAEQSFHSELAWQAVDHVEYSPAASQSALSLTLSSKDKAWFVHSVPARSATGEGGTLAEPLCPPDRLRVLVHAELQSADGALAESFDEALEARSPSVATLTRSLVADQIAGSFAITQVTPPASLGTAQASVQNLEFVALLTPAGMAGSLTGVLSSTNSQVASASPLTFARFPSDLRCVSADGTGKALPIEANSAALGQTGFQAVDVINAWGALPFHWDDGTRSALTLKLSDLADGCVEVPSSSGFQEPGQPAVTVVYPVVLQAASSDGRWQGQYPASLVTWPSAAGNGFSQRIDVNGTFLSGASDGTGFEPVSIPSGTQRLSMRLEALFEGTNASGRLTLDALKDPPCVTNPEPPSGNSSPPCSGTTVTRVLGASWPD